MKLLTLILFFPLAFFMITACNQANCDNPSDMQSKTEKHGEKKISKKSNFTNQDNDRQRNPEILIYEEYRNKPEKMEEYFNKLMRLQIERSFGKNFPEEKISQIQGVSATARREKRILEKDLQAGKITNDQFKERLGTIFKEMDQKYRNILTPEEYKKFMNIDD